MRKILFKIKKTFKRKLSVFHFLNAFLLLTIFTIPFLSGSFTAEAKKENISNQIADKVKNNTRTKNLMAVSVGETSDSGSFPYDDEKEFYALYGIFRQENITYASGFNISKEHTITIPELGNSINYSIFFNAKDSTVQEPSGHYRHWYYPIEYMFPAVRLYDICRYMIYITQSQADILLENDGFKRGADNTYDENDYKTLIKRIVQVNIDGVDERCIIGNIIYEQNYYYNGLKEVLNDFFAIAYFYPRSLARKNMYFFNNYSYQNSYFMNYINRTYENKLFDVEVVRNNIVKTFDYNLITRFYYDNLINNNLLLYIFLVVLSLFGMCVVAVLNFVKCWDINIKYFLLLGFVIFVPYIIFFIISRARHSVLFFSNQGISLYVYFLIFFLGIHLIICAVNAIYKYHLRKKTNICKR